MAEDFDDCTEIAVAVGVQMSAEFEHRTKMDVVS